MTNNKQKGLEHGLEVLKDKEVSVEDRVKATEEFLKTI